MYYPNPYVTVTVLVILADEHCIWQCYGPAPTEEENITYILTKLAYHSLHECILLGYRSGKKT